jgi:hypothetical protein
MAPHAGFSQALVARDTSNEASHLILRIWESQAAYDAFRATPDGGYGKGRPEGLYQNRPVDRFFTQVAHTAGSGQGDFLVRALLNVTPEKWDAFTATRRAHDSARVPVGGVTDMGLWRWTEGDHALALHQQTSRADWDRWDQSAERAAYRTQAPAGLASALEMGFYQVVTRVGAKD